METLVIDLALSLLQMAPKIIDAVKSSAALSEEEKKAYLDRLTEHLDATAAKVAAVTFKQV